MLGSVVPESDLTGACPRVVVEQSGSAGVEDIYTLPAAGSGVESPDVSVAEEGIRHRFIVPGVQETAALGTCVVVVAAEVVIGIASG